MRFLHGIIRILRRYPLRNSILFLLLLLLCADTTRAGRMTTEAQTYQQMFDKGNLVVIATALDTKDTDERTTLLGDVNVIGVQTEFAVRLTLKGSANIKRFLLHHYREPDDQFTENGPHLVSIHLSAGRHPDFLMFLIREKDGRYAPLTGQTDPGSFSVLELRSGVPTEGLP